MIATSKFESVRNFSALSQWKKKSVTVFDLKELTNKNFENDHLWQRIFRDSNIGCFCVDGGSIKSKMVVVSVGGRSVDIYDFWPDRDYEVTDNIDSEESEDDDEDHSVESDESEDEDEDHSEEFGESVDEDEDHSEESEEREDEGVAHSNAQDESD